MSLLQLVNNGIASAVIAAGDAIVDVKIAAQEPFRPRPGEDYRPSWLIYSGKGFLEHVDTMDYPHSTIQTTDATLVLLQCSHDVETHEFVLIDGQTYHVYDVKAELVGLTRVLQKLLVRPESKEGIAWASLEN